MDIITVFAAISTVIAIYCSVPYIKAILNGKTKPHQFSWLVFVILNAITFLSQYLEGARESALIAFAFFFGSFIIFLLSFKYGTRDTSRWDRLLLAFALVTIALWIFTENNVLAIWLTIAIDTAATCMTILKIRAQPTSEAASPWVLASIAYVFTCLTLIDTPFGILYARPTYGLLGDLAIVIAIYTYSKKSSEKISISPVEG